MDERCVRLIGSRIGRNSTIRQRLTYLNETATADAKRPLVRRGFLLSLLGLSCVIAAVLWWASSTVRGGHIGNSPDGRFSLSVWGPLEPGLGDTYMVQLIESESNLRLQTLSITVADNEYGPTIRGQAEIIWSDDGSSVTLWIASTPKLVLYLPAAEQ